MFVLYHKLLSLSVFILIHSEDHKTDIMPFFSVFGRFGAESTDFPDFYMLNRFAQNTITFVIDFGLLTYIFC